MEFLLSYYGFTVTVVAVIMIVIYRKSCIASWTKDWSSVGGRYVPVVFDVYIEKYMKSENVFVRQFFYHLKKYRSANNFRKRNSNHLDLYEFERAFPKIPTECFDFELCWLVSNGYGHLLLQIPIEKWTEELTFIFIYQHPILFDKLPDHMKTPRLFELSCQRKEINEKFESKMLISGLFLIISVSIIIFTLFIWAVQ